MMRHIKVFTILALSTLAISLSACETIHGAGQDVEHAGESIQNAAKDVQNGE